ncbi:MAG: hypothetical protein RR998_06365 [Oscillospiraceae bacterium]
MTGNELLDSALALLMTNRKYAPEYLEFALPLVNMLLAEIHGSNNALRASRGLAEYESPQSIIALDDALPCEDELCVPALAHGLVAKLIMDDGDMAKTAYYQNQYVNGVLDAAQYVCAPIDDFYAKGAAE